MKIGVSSYSYWQYLAAGEMDIYEVIRLAAETGYEGIEFANLEYPVDLKRDDFARSLQQACKKEGLEVCACAVGGDFTRENLAAEIERLKGEIDFTSALGAPVMRTDIMADFTDEYNTLERCLSRVQDAVRQLADYGLTKNVLLTTENHGRLFCESSRLEQLISRVDRDNFRLLADLGNFVDADEDCSYAIGRLGAWIRHVHIKDFHVKKGNELYPGEGWFISRGGNYLRGAVVGHGNVPVLECIKVLQDKGYDDWLIVEFEGIEDPEQATKLGLKNIQRMLQAVCYFRWNENDI